MTFNPNRKKCPVCRNFKLFDGPACQGCHDLGYREQPNGSVRRTPTTLEKTTMPKSIKEYLPNHVKLVNVQGRVPEAIFEPCRAIMDQEKLNWNQVLTACLEKFLDDMKGKGK